MLSNRGTDGVRISAAEGGGQSQVIVEDLTNRGRRIFQDPPHEFGQVHLIVNLEQ